jgi:hypothetical protein
MPKLPLQQTFIFLWDPNAKSPPTNAFQKISLSLFPPAPPKRASPMKRGVANLYKVQILSGSNLKRRKHPPSTT